MESPQERTFWTVALPGCSCFIYMFPSTAAVHAPLYSSPHHHHTHTHPGLDLLGTGDQERLLSRATSHRYWLREAEVRP